MAELDGQGLLHIKKYPNRRYYDTTRSCHVTLKEVHELVMSGRDVCITDSRTGDDITNLVLMQILIEKDQPKLDLFPASVMHMMVRANRQALRGYVDQFFSPFLGVMARSRSQFDGFMRRMMSGQFVSPAEWGSYLAQAFSPVPSGASGPDVGPEAGEPDVAHDPVAGTVGSADSSGGWARDGSPSDRGSVGEADVPPDESRVETTEELRDQLAELTRRIEELSERGTPNST